MNEEMKNQTEQLPLLKVHMMGSFFLEYGDQPISFRKTMATKSMRLLQIFLYNKDNGISRGRLLESTYGREDVADAANSLRVGVHRLKRSLVEAGLPQFEYIYTQKGVYHWTSPMPVEVDAIDIKNKILEAGKETDEKARMDQMIEALELYTGEFLADFGEEEWVQAERAQLKKVYSDALKEVSEYLLKNEEFDELQKLTSVASELYPFDEWQAVQMQALIGLERYKEAMKLYEQTSKHYFEELGVTPSEKLVEQYRYLGSRMGSRHRVIEEVQADLQESPGEKGGAFFCSLAGFRDCYRLVYRMSELNGQMPWLMLCTITDGKGYPAKGGPRLDRMSEKLLEVMKRSLRHSDFLQNTARPSM
ncbi:transcriptional regulator [Blautia sp. AF34-10]|uniref:AfsR/SARP family transcriptional regulator n=1 Tax=unclassified Blautia TaxID=2648079 RepID=UPI000E5C5B1A|nr:MULTISPECIES: BTAD domain-containing putative transcriptional regulator [unclassified Blautia]RHP36591.1 transcriptional regulator [Blautia sp. AF34-10]RHV78063.1 transcriptional regulator [Blautia sp. OF11-22]